MQINYNLRHRLIAWVLFVGLFLQNCGVSSNQIIPQQKALARDTSELSDNPVIEPNKTFVTSDGYLASFYQEDGELKADIKVDEKQPKPNYKRVPVVIEQGVCLTTLTKLDPKTQQNRIQLNRKNGKIKQVIVFNNGVVGGMKKDKEAIVKKEEKVQYNEDLTRGALGLPSEIWRDILLHGDSTSVLRMRKSCSTFNYLIKDDKLLIKQHCREAIRSMDIRTAVLLFKLGYTKEFDLHKPQDNVIDTQDNEGNTLLHLFIEEEDVEVTRLLIKQGAGINIKNNEGNTSAHLSARNGNTEIFKLLLSKGPDFSARNEDGDKPLDLAAKHNHPKILEIVKLALSELIGYIVLMLTNESVKVYKQEQDKNNQIIDRIKSLESNYNDLRDILHFLIKDNDKKMLALFLAPAQATEIIAKDKDGNTLLHIAAQQGNVGVVSLLIDKLAGPVPDKKADRLERKKWSKLNNIYLNIRNNKGLSLLHIATSNGNWELVEYLIDRGANINSATKHDRYTPLHIATSNGNLELVKYLIHRGANINSETKHDRYTPLHIATSNGNSELVEYLIHRGAKLDATTKDGCTLAQKNEHKCIVNLSGTRSANEFKEKVSTTDTDYTDTDYKKRICPNCEGGCRYLYRLSDQNKNIVLMCEECNAIWFQEHINWGQAVSDEDLKSKFEVEDSEDLFDETCSDWATEAEAKQTNWGKNFYKTPTLVYKINILGKTKYI